MSFSSLSSSLIEVGKALKKEIFSTLKDNDDDHETRINALEAGASKVFVFDKVYFRPGAEGSAIAGVGLWAFMSESEFQARFGTDWVLANGTSVAGTDLASLGVSSLPDVRGRSLRMKDHGEGRDRGGDRALGNYQSDGYESHRHLVFHDVDTSNSLTAVGGTDPHPASLDTGNYEIKGYSSAPDIGQSSTSGQSDETTTKNICANLFVRKNDGAGTDSGLDFFRAPAGFQLLSAIVTNIEAGSSGTLEIDIKKGSSLSALTTVFSTKPSVTAASGDYASSSNAVFSDNDVSANDWLRLDVSSFQVQQTRFHAYVVGEFS